MENDNQTSSQKEVFETKNIEQLDRIESRTCYVCKTEKIITLFSDDKKDKKSNRCKECTKEYLRMYYLKNKETIREKAKQYSERNKEKINDRAKKYYQDNKEKVKVKVRLYAKKNKDKYSKYYKERRKNNIHVGLRSRLSSRIRAALKRYLIKKTNKTSDLVGCSLQEFKDYLTALFQPQMSWENYGLWEIDHCIPLNLFNLTSLEEQKQAFHFTNMCPRWATTEIAKQHGSNQMGNANKQDNLIDDCYYHLLQNPS